MRSSSGLLLAGGFVVDTASATLRRHGRAIALRPKTWALLQCLAHSPGRLFTRAELKQLLWPGLVVVDDSLTQCVTELRRALGDDSKRLVRTVSRLGYRLEGVAAEVPVGMGAAWEALRSLEGPAGIDSARQAFELAYEEGRDRGEALAGIALSHVIDVLNRWSRAPAWQVNAAREAADEAIALEPTLALGNHARAHVAMLQGRYAEAQAGFRQALSQDPGLAHARVRLAVAALELGRAVQAQGHLEQALRACDGSPSFVAQVLFARGMTCFHLGRDDEALACMKEALAHKGGLAFAHQWIAAIEALAGHESVAARHLAQFRAVLPKHTIESLQASERSSNPEFRAQRTRFYEGLRRAGLPVC